MRGLLGLFIVALLFAGFLGYVLLGVLLRIGPVIGR